MPLSLTDRLTLTLAALNLAVLFFQLLLLKRQADISLRQAEISSGQLVATADSAAAAKKQAEVAEKTLVNLERSHLFVDEVKPVFTTSPRQFGRHAGQIIYMVELQIGLVIRNFGKYAATLERYTVKVEIPSKHGEIPQMRRDERLRISIIRPGDSREVEARKTMLFETGDEKGFEEVEINVVVGLWYSDMTGKSWEASCGYAIVGPDRIFRIRRHTWDKRVDGP